MKKIFTLAALAFAVAANAQYVSNPAITGTGYVAKCDAGENITRDLSGKWDGTAAINMITNGTKVDKKTGETVADYANEYEVISIDAKANNVYVIGVAGSKLMVRAISLGGAIQKSFIGIEKDASATAAQTEEEAGKIKFMTSEATTGKGDTGYDQTFNGVTYSGENYAQGTNNGMSWAVQPSEAGKLDFAIKMGGNKKTYVIEIDATAYEAEAGEPLTLAGAYAAASGSGLCSDFQALVSTAVQGIAEAKSEAKAAPVKVITANGIQIGNYNVAGQQVK